MASLLPKQSPAARSGFPGGEQPLPGAAAEVRFPQAPYRVRLARCARRLLFL